MCFGLYSLWSKSMKMMYVCVYVDRMDRWRLWIARSTSSSWPRESTLPPRKLRISTSGATLLHRPLCMETVYRWELQNTPILVMYLMQCIIYFYLPKILLFYYYFLNAHLLSTIHYVTPTGLPCGHYCAWPWCLSHMGQEKRPRGILWWALQKQGLQNIFSAFWPSVATSFLEYLKEKLQYWWLACVFFAI